MVLAVGTLSIVGGIVSAIISPYDVEMSDNFQNYMGSFDDEAYKNIDVEASGNTESDYAEYESSFKFGTQAKQTYSQTKEFTVATTGILGLSNQVWYIIITVVFVLILLGIAAYLRGVGKI